MSESKLTLSDFVEGFRYQMKERFSDGTVKTREDYDNAKWIDCVFTEGDMPYIKRIFNGKNAASGLFGLRRPVYYRVAQYGKIFCVELKNEDRWVRVDVFGRPLDIKVSHPLQMFDSLEAAFDAIKELPGELPKPVHFYPEK